MKKLLTFLVLLAIVAGAVWTAAGREAGPRIDIVSPQSAIGRAGSLTLEIETPRGRLKSLDVSLEQGKASASIFSLDGSDAAQLVPDGPNRLRLTRPIGKQQMPQLEAGAARIVVTASRPVLFGYRRASSTATRDVSVRLAPPVLSVVSTLHYINQGGAEMIVYRVSPSNVASGVQVGDYTYPGYPASGAHIANADPGLRVALFALLWNQTPQTPISLYARDDVGNETHATFDYQVFPRVFRVGRINLDDNYLRKVVPPILANAPDLKVPDPSNLLQAYVQINRELRREDAEKITALSRETAPEMLWEGPFKQMADTAVEARYADQRTYFYKGEAVDHEVHLGYDLASVAGAPVYAANRGRIVHAGWLDIYGNCVIIDHGMGLQSLYGHMSSISVKVGEMVDKGTELGHTGSTGLAGGDHLHFGVLLDGNAISPIDWWSAKWVHDRIERKLEEAGATPPAVERQAAR